MASEPSDEQALSVALPAGLDEWLDGKAGALDASPEEVVVQLLAAYRAADELDDDLDPATLFDGDVSADDVEPAVREVVEDRIPDVVAAVAEHQGADSDAGEVEERLAVEIERLQSDFEEKLADVRERVVQVKRETDRKAPSDHGHPEIDELASTIEGLESRLGDLASAVEDGQTTEVDVADEVETIAARLDEVEERLRTVAWVVSDLKDDSGLSRRAIDRLKRAAAEADVDRAACENCDSGVHIALLSEPTCPHCDATVTDVRPSSGLFGKARLTVAKPLEAGEDADRSDVPDGAGRE